MIDLFKVLVNMIDRIGDSALIKCAKENHLMCAKMLLDHRNIDLNIKNSDGRTALEIAKLNPNGALIFDLIKNAEVEDVRNLV